MKKLQQTMMLAFIMGGFLVVPFVSQAISGTNADNVKVKVYAKQGEKWFKALVRHTDNKSILTIKNVLPGWYKMVIDEDDQTSGQILAVRLRMLDSNGKRIHEEIPVNLYAKVNGVKTSIGSVETDKRGWIEVSGLSSGVEYLMDIDEKNSSSLSEKEGRARIKVKTKVAGNDWFVSAYKRTDTAMIFTAENVIPAYYKFSYKSGDRDPSLPFTLRIRLRDNKGEKIKEPTLVKLWTYLGPEKTLTSVGQMMTDAYGWVTIPGVMTEMKYKIEVVD